MNRMAAEIPEHWLPARAVHLCPQVGRRHADNLRWLRDRADWISVDPSPHYSCERTAAEHAGGAHPVEGFAGGTAGHAAAPGRNSRSDTEACAAATGTGPRQ